MPLPTAFNHLQAPDEQLHESSPPSSVVCNAAMNFLRHASFPHHDDQVPRLAKQPLHQLSLADLVKHGRPPLSAEALLSSARFTLSLLPIRLAHRIQALRNLPYIVVSNSHITKIYNNYQHSLSTLLPWLEDSPNSKHTLSTLDDEIRFTEVLAELVHTHTDTIPILAQGFLECRRYISPGEVTRFLDEHLRARIGTRLIAEQHIALHFSSKPHFDPGASPTPCTDHPSFIGVIDTALRPAGVIDSCGEFVADICELKYGVRPRWEIDGDPDTTFAFVPNHLEYIVTELLKNAFRATVESGMTREPVVITIAPEPPTGNPPQPPSSTPPPRHHQGRPRREGGSSTSDAIRPLDDNAPGVTIRIRDRGGGIGPEILPNIWSYSFTTMSEDDDVPGNSGGGGSSINSSSSIDALNVISSSSNGGSSIAGLGYGLPLGRAYAEYFGGGVAVQSLYGWGTDVYLRLKGVGRIE
ncbi:3-methyl-2-oxobutanoate dehydrogenase lipoamide kinase [Diaporthe amygdali]|uniref:3-methyl-2-oxobutanoate dehydrogenase lipoamide kinase n=1 Tax=Phomopsis amygdali TaxID=1214568 RepID=UPI0022FECF34|nr:3-methyl-2-oxobutanoate dehydrogenase lipoamide kinase [Diaporthe amygdali]KAJ0115309.1 3-methyl-2-oxobutanoate dehydrogenase lipoamide kinase [Diaporthe amygdali]